MSSKMLAGLVAGGFGAALSIGLTLSAHFSPQLAYFLAVALLFGLGALAGVLAAAWLDLPDYGHQHTAGAIAGLVAAALTEVSDVILRLLFASMSSSSPTSVLENLIESRLPAPDAAARILFIVLVNLLLYLIYVLIAVGISSAVASFVGRRKNTGALQALLDAHQQPLPPDPTGEDLMDPALLPFMRPEYSPFAEEEPPIPVPLWQQRRTQPRGAPPIEPYPPARNSRPASRPAPPSGPYPPVRKSGPLPGGPRSGPLPGGPRSGPLPGGPRSGPLPGKPGPARGTASGVVPRRSTPGMRPPPDAPWPRPRDKD